MSDGMDLYRPAQMKGHRIMVTQELRDRMVIMREVEHLSWAQIGRNFGHSPKWAYETGKSLGLPMRGICKHAGHRTSKMRETIRRWILMKAAAGEVVGKYIAIAGDLGVSEGSIKRTVRIMRGRGEITRERLGQGRNLFRLVSHGP